jgi:hypothetical protein
MPLQEQYTELPLTGGLDEKANKEGAVNGFLQLDNLEYSDDADSVRQRHGFKRVELFTTNNEHGFIASGDAYTRITGGYKNRTLGTTWNGRRVFSTDSAVSATQILVVTEEYIESETLNWSVAYPNRLISWALRNRTTWALIASGGVSGTGTGAFSPRVVLDVDNATFNLFYCVGTLGAAVTLKCDQISSAGGVVTTTIDTNVQSEVRTVSGSAIDAVTHGICTVVAWNSAAGNIKLANFTAAGGVSATYNDTVSTTSFRCSVAVSFTLTTVVVFYYDASDGHASVYPLALGSRTRGTKGGTPVITHSSDLLWSFTLTLNGSGTVFQCACAADSGMRTSSYDASNNAVSGASQYIAMTPVTKAFNNKLIGIQYFDAGTGVASFPSILIVDLTNGSLIAQAAFEETGVLAGGPAKATPVLAGVSGTDPFTVTVTVSEETADAVSSGVPVCRARTVEFTQVTDVYPTATLCGVGFVGGSTPRVWDASGFKPAAAPAVAIAPVLSSSGTGLTGTYSYCIVLEYTDARGNFQVSPPSVASAITISDKTVTIFVTVPTTLFGVTVRTKLYRTANAGSTFYLLRSFIQSAPTLTLTDTLADSFLTKYETIYTNAQLASELGPPLLALTTHRNRLFGIRADDPRTIAFTQETTDPFLPRWNSVLTLQVDNTAGDPTALASLDDKVLIFQKDQIVAISGQGPDANGSGEFSLPEVVARGVGVDANNRRSACVFPDGVMFRHSSGIYMIDRQLQVIPIGLSIQRTLGSANVWVARYFPSRHQIWVFLDPSTYTGGGTCPILVFDVRYTRWSTFTPSFGNVRDGIEVAGQVYVLEASSGNGVSGRVYQLDTTSFVDKVDGVTPTYLPATIQIPWFRGAGRNGTQRLRGMSLHGQLVNGTGVGVVVDTYTQKNQELAKSGETADSHYAFGTSLLGSLPAGGFSLPLRVITQRCSAFRARVTFTPTSTDAESLRLTALTLRYGAEPAKGKAPVGRKPVAS